MELEFYICGKTTKGVNHAFDTTWQAGPLLVAALILSLNMSTRFKVRTADGRILGQMD